MLSGKYVGYLPEHYAKSFVKEDRLRPILPSEFVYQAPFSMICRRGRSRELFIQTMRELLSQQTAKSAK
ncbi:hypothetical protein [Marinomonas posidonica]|uniref:hypothetical protein n=1 Tax=Marinomonas posidonica TaxID=936476 RepID=UPI0009FD3A09|nr:hypothetical protein [Marinomonas posidonica]